MFLVAYSVIPFTTDSLVVGYEDFRGTNRLPPFEQLSKWKNELSEKDINSILDMLKKFEIEIYDDNIFPVKTE